MTPRTAVPGERVTVDVHEAGWPYRIQIGDHTAPGMPARHTRRGKVHATAHRACPDLPAGDWPVVVHDRTGPHPVGTITIR